MEIWIIWIIAIILILQMKIGKVLIFKNIDFNIMTMNKKKI